MVDVRHPQWGSPRVALYGSQAMSEHDKVNILMVDDQPAKLLSY